MIELAMVRQMVRRGLIAGPIAAATFGLLGGRTTGISVAIGVALALANLWLAGRIIGGLAENRPDLLLAGAFAAFLLGFALLGAAAALLPRVAWVDFPVTGVAMIASHLVLVTWQASDAFLKLPPRNEQSPTSSGSVGIRS
ncbi:MAG TPA: hypothetical protein VM573_01305 [Actinomycetota bacterium]|nr:hypothetical protein [Actinomycetota bacterium]